MTRNRLVPDSTHREPGDHGSAAAEFAIIAPVLLLLLFVMVTLASVFFDNLNLQAAARDAARSGSVDIDSACSVARELLSTNDVGSLTCEILEDCSSGMLRVSLTALSSYSIPILGDRNVRLAATSSFVCQ